VQDDDDDALGRALDLRLGSTDIPLLLQDRRLGPSGEFVRDPDAADLFLGMLGATPMTNYLSEARLDAEARIYRFRLLNGASARVFRLAFVHDGLPRSFTIIGADGGLLARPIAAEEAFLGPGERLDVLLDLRAVPPGAQVLLRSLEFDPMRAGLAALCRTSAPEIGRNTASVAPGESAGGGFTAKPADGVALELLRIHVRSGGRYPASIPARLSEVPDIGTRQAQVRDFLLDHERMRWSINGVRFDMVKTQLSVERGAVEIWQFRNPPGGMPHPVHLHGFSFRMLERRGSPQQMLRLAVDGRGLTAAETGWKDTFVLWPGERVRVAIDFTHDYPGEQVYMLHCHNLEHEDQGMMLNVRIVPPGSRRT
jgi:suppressor of ftsI/bilirubin oxidase